MFCINCGAQLPDGSKFCDMCGTKQIDRSAQAQSYSQPVPPVYAQPAQPQPNYEQPLMNYSEPQMDYSQPQSQPKGFVPQVNGSLLLEAGEFTCFLGGGPIGVVQGQGFVDVYDDRIEFRKTSGAQWGFAANPIVGVLAAQHDKKKNPVVTYNYSDIKNIKSGKYSGMIPTFILEFNNGKSLSFAKTAKSKQPQEVIDLVKSYI
jgi:hypothetical protein